MSFAFFLFLFLNQSILAQSNSQWFTPSKTTNIYPTYKAFDSQIDSTIDLHFFSFDTIIDNPHITYIPIDIKIYRFLLYKDNKIDSSRFFANGYNPLDYNTQDHNWRLFGLRGKLKGKEILIIDNNYNKNFVDEKIIFLDSLLIQFPQEQLNFKNIYPIQNYFTLPIDYQYMFLGQIYNLKNNLGFGVRSKYDTLNKKMYYVNDFSIGFAENLHFDCTLNYENFIIEFEKQFPWQGNRVDITLSSNNIRQNLKPKHSFKLKKEDINYIIDSIDFLNNRVLITKTNETPSYVELSKYKKISTYPIQRNTQYKVLHFWGSWCVGCLKNFPELKELSIKYPNINFYGVAVDDNLAEIDKLIQKYKLNWEMYQIGFGDFKNIKEDVLSIQSYPTYLALSEKNEILARFSSVHDLGKFLNTLTNNPNHSK